MWPAQELVVPRQVQLVVEALQFSVSLIEKTSFSHRHQLILALTWQSSGAFQAHTVHEIVLLHLLGAHLQEDGHKALLGMILDPHQIVPQAIHTHLTVLQLLEFPWHSRAHTYQHLELAHRTGLGKGQQMSR